MSNDKYENAERRIDTVAGRNEYWMQLRQAKADYDALPANERGIDAGTYPNFGSGFYYWMQYRYGIEILYNEEGKIQGEYNVVDKDLYLVFLLTYSV